MLRRILKYRAHRQARVSLEVLFDTIRAIRRQSDSLAITPTITGYFWMGVNRATHALFPGSVLELPHVLAASAYSHRELMDICRHVHAQGFSQVILSGFPPCFESLALRFRDHGMKVGCVFHGFLAECGLNPFNSQAFKTILQLCRDGVIAKLACCKKGLPETIGRLTGLRAHKIMVPTRVTAASAGQTIRRGPGEWHIGVLAHDTFRKNIHNQVAAALMIEGATVHVAGRPEFDYWGWDHRLVYHPKTMGHRDYLGLLGQMDVNLHLSFSESWGQVTAESLAMGVPCMIANHSDVYDYDSLLRARLVSHNFDNPYELSEEVASVIAERDALADRCIQYVDVLNQKAEDLLKEFLEA
jgi:glycosyltransferase involved in cell wall biosynthesis